MLDITYEKAKEVYSDNLTDVWEQSHVIVMVDVIKFTIYKKSDIILVFSPQGDLVLQTERLYKNNYTSVEKLKIICRLIKGCESKDSEIFNSFSISDTYIDITNGKRWWKDWAKRLVY